MKHLSTTDAAKILGVSGATIRNWSKAGHLQPIDQRPIVFDREEVFALKERIRTNRFSRLRKRANKSASDKLAPSEILTPRITADLAKIAKFINGSDIDPVAAVFIAAMHLLLAEGEVHFSFEQANLDFEGARWKRGAVREVMTEWFQRMGNPILPVTGPGINSFLAWDEYEDRLGLLYQGLLSAGRKSQTGAFFTPGDVIDASLAGLGGSPGSFLDPCCGTGRYLVHAARKFALHPARIYGFDNDPVAVDIARINILLVYRALDVIPEIHALDSLRDLAGGAPDCATNHLIESIDAIATNPPWGGCKNVQRHKNLVGLIRSGESFSLFLEKSLQLLRPGGTLSFLLPEAILKIKAHVDIRRLLLKETCIQKISMLGRVFPGVFTPIIRLDLLKAPPPDDWMVAVDCSGNVHQAAQNRFHQNANQTFDVAVRPDDARLLDKIYGKEHLTLQGNADWALGIVTGDNKRCVLDAPCPGSEPVLRGRDVLKFATRPARNYIRFQPKAFQQVAPEQFYRAPEKLVYRFVSDRLVFAYDDQGTLTLNSANILIPQLPGYTMMAAMAFLNSSIFQYIFIKRFRTHKILRGDLETLPFPVLPKTEIDAISAQAEKCMGGDYRPAEVLDDMIFSVFGLQQSEIEVLKSGLTGELQ